MQTTEAPKRKLDTKRLRGIDALETYLTMVVGLFIAGLVVATIGYAVVYH